MGDRDAPVTVWEFLLQVVDRQDRTDRLIAISAVLLKLVLIAAVGVVVVFDNATTTTGVGAALAVVGAAQWLRRRLQQQRG